jgi:threonine/homoserine/homoserine lactone efflux protein
MFNTVWIATALGIFGGPLLAYLGAKWLLRQMRVTEPAHSQRVRFAQFGALLAAFPGFFTAFILGGIGAALGEAAFGQTGVLFGIAIGIAIVFGAILLLGVHRRQLRSGPADRGITQTLRSLTMACSGRRCASCR